MYAFVRTDAGLFKVYRHEYDWQIIGPDFERWSSIWRADPESSFQRAVWTIPSITSESEVFRTIE